MVTGRRLEGLKTSPLDFTHAFDFETLVLKQTQPLAATSGVMNIISSSIGSLARSIEDRLSWSRVIARNTDLYGKKSRIIGLRWIQCRVYLLSR